MNAPWPAVPAADPPPPSGPPRAVSAMQALQFAWSSPDWTNDLLLGTVFMFIPVIGPLALQGWHCEIQQRLARRHPRPIPKLDFSDLGHYIERGIYPFVVNLILVLPLVLVFYVIGFGGTMAAVLAADPHGRHGGGDPAIGIAIAAGFLLFTLLVMLPAMVILNAAITRAELSEQIGYSLSMGPVWRYASRTWPKFLAATFVFGLLGLGLIVVGMLALCIGLYPVTVALQLGSTHLRWQVYEADRAAGGEAIILKAPVAVPSEARVYGPPGGFPPNRGW